MKTFSEWLISEVGVVGIAGGATTATATTPAPKITATTTTPDPKKIQQKIVNAYEKDLNNPQGKGVNLSTLMVTNRPDVENLIKTQIVNKVIKK